MRFKQWLHLIEYEGQGDDSLALMGHPPTAGDYVQASRSARNFQVYRDRMKAAHRLGNTLINFDWEQLERIPIVSPKGKELPTDQPWKHKQV